MTRCPWFSHDVEPDPEELGIGEDVVGMCLVCSLKYVVARTSPSYQLKRDTDGSASTIFALAKLGRNKAYKKLLSAKGVPKALQSLGLKKKHLK